MSRETVKPESVRRTTAAGMGRAPAWVTGEEGARTITVTTGNFYMNARPHPRADGSPSSPGPGLAGLRRRPGQLRDRLRPGLPRPGVHRPCRPATAGAHGRAAPGPGDQAPRRTPP